MSAFALSFSQSSGTIRFPWIPVTVPCYGQYTTIPFYMQTLVRFIFYHFSSAQTVSIGISICLFPKNAKDPGSCPPGSLFMGFYEILHYLCVLFFSISLLRDLLYAYKFKTSRTIDTNSVGRSSINIWYTGIYVMKSCRHILYEIKAIGTMSSIHRPSLLLKLS